MIVRIKTLQDAEFEIWKDEIEFVAKSKSDAARQIDAWILYFHRKGLDVRVEKESVESYDVPCTKL